MTKFNIEVNIAKLQRGNLVRLLCCCTGGEEKLLVHKYMPNKSYSTFIFLAGVSTLIIISCIYSTNAKTDQVYNGSAQISMFLLDELLI